MTRHAGAGIRAMGGVLAAVLSLVAAGQENPVYVDDSPGAWELLRQARDQVADNRGEAVRLYQQLLDEYPLKLAPRTDAAKDHYVSIRQLVLADLRSDQALLRRYQLIESAEGERLLEAGAVRELALSRSLTEAGLDATVLLGQRSLEAGRFHTALFWLDEAQTHPRLDERRALHCWSMRAMATHFTGDTDAHEAARSALLDLGPAGERAEESLQSLVENHRSSRWRRGISPAHPPRPIQLDDLVPQAIWAVPLEESLAGRRNENTSPFMPRGTARLRQGDGRFLTGAPTVADHAVYINEGHAIMAYDRYTGHPLWAAPFRDAPSMPGFEQDPDVVSDMNLIAISGDTLVTLTGHASGDSRSGEGRLVCLNPRTGQRRWTRSLHMIGNNPDHEGLFPHGEPIIVGNSVYVLARRVNRQLLSSCYVVALNLEDGGLLWSRHIASSAGLRKSSRPFSSLVYRAGDLYVATPLGATARLQADTGLVWWLRTQRVPVMTTQLLMNAQPWEIAAPVVTKDRVIAFHPDFQRVAVFDREQGDLRQTIDVSTVAGWNGPRYMLADDRNLYAIGRTVRAVPLDDLSFVTWRLPAMPQSEADSFDQPPPVDFPALQGRVQLVEGGLIVPTIEGARLIDADTGLVRRELTTESVGNPLAIDSEVLVATATRLDAYMSFTRAEQMLRRRIAATPQDPDAALALLRLGLRVDNVPLMLEAAELATRAIDGSTAVNRTQLAQGELFDLLLYAAQRTRDTSEATASLFAVLGSITSEPHQRVEFLLAKGDWLTRHDLQAAVEAYHTVIAENHDGTQWRSEGGIAREAASWGRMRLAAVIESHGDGVHAAMDAFARDALERLQSTPGVDPSALEALADRYPLSAAARRAARLAAQGFVQRDEPRRAASVLLRAYQRDTRAATAQELVGAIVEVCAEQHWNDLAASVLDDARRRYGDLHVAFKDAVVTLGALSERIAVGPADRPSIGAPIDVFDQFEDAQLVLPVAGTKVDVPTTYVLFHVPGHLQLRSASDLEARWTVPLNTSAVPELLGADQETVLLWLDGATPNPHPLMLSAIDGSLIWTGRPLENDPLEAMERRPGAQEQMPDGRPFDLSETLPLLAQRTMVVVQRLGDLAGYDLRDGTRPAWHVEDVLDRIHFAVLTEHSLILAGMQAELGPAPRRTPTMTPMIVILDPQTGNLLQRLRPFGDGGVHWVALAGLGGLVFGTDTGVESVDLLSGARQWVNNGVEALDTTTGWPLPDRVVVHGSSLGLRTIDVSTGVLSHPFDAPLYGEWDPRTFREVHIDGERIYARYDERLLRYDADGGIDGADIVMTEREYRWLRPAADQLVLVSSLRSRQRRDNANRFNRVTQYVYRIYRFSEDCKLLDDPVVIGPQVERVEDVMLIDGWLLLATNVSTIAVPMPTD